MKHPNLFQTRDMLLDLVWGYDSLVERNVVDVYIRYLRNKLDVPGKDISCQQNYGRVLAKILAGTGFKNKLPC
jgi:DNA-binding response OmpR family regulator